ncbi:MAG: DUF6489 family protein [Phaeospirillum sp.]|nr:DUF6489 family protein [Phaeospirillum sp.]
MKITVDVDCTPDELRTFFGLPDVKPMQEALMKQVQDQMAANLHAMEPEAMFKVWMPAGIQGMEQMQKMLWSQFTTAGARPKEK